MKTAKRLLAVLLLVLMSVSLMVACTPDEDKPTGSQGSDPTGSTSGDVHVLPPRPVEEMSGKDFIIIQHQAETSPFGYAENSQLAEKAFKRMEDVENLYGCTLSFSTLAYNDSFATAFQALAYEDNSGDLVFSHNNAQLRKTIGTGGQESMLQPLLQYDNILDFWNTEKWGNITAKETMMAGENFYAVTPALWINYLPLTYYNLVYNKELLEDFGQTDLQEYYENETWTRDQMFEVITSCYDDTGADVVYGLGAAQSHMIRASFLAAGCTPVTINSIAEDGTVDWTNGWLTPEADEALSYLKTQLTSNAKYFNNGEYANTWDDGYNPFVAGQCVMGLTRPLTLLNNIVVEADFSYGLMPWAGPDANYMSGYYENTASVAIPTFAQNGEWSAFLMWDLFEGLEGTATYDDVVAYYRETYFETDLDMEILLNSGRDNLQYSYWPNGGDDTLNAINGSFLSASIANLIQSHAGLTDTVVNDYIVPNKVALEKYKAEGKF